MNSLEISLVLLAGLAIAAVFGYNLWTTRRRGWRRDAPAAGEAPGGDRPGERREPSLDVGRASSAGDEGGQGPAAAHDTAAAPGARAHAALSPIADCVVELRLASPAPGERLIALTRDLRRAGSKPILVEALAAATDAGEAPGAEPASRPVDPEPDETWEPLSPGRTFGALRVGVLLANRHGPLNAMEFSEYVSAVQALADQLSVLADTPDMAMVLARARELDEVCANLDAQIGIGVEAPQPLSVADLGRLALECGCVERGNNRHARLGPAGEVLFSLALADAPNRLQLLLDVPRAPASLAPWRDMLECAQRCAQLVGGPLVDDEGRPLPEVQFARVEEQLAQRYASLEAAGFPAGSGLALRLFN